MIVKETKMHVLHLIIYNALSPTGDAMAKLQRRSDMSMFKREAARSGRSVSSTRHRTHAGRGRVASPSACLALSVCLALGAGSPAAADEPVEAVTEARFDQPLGFVITGKVAEVPVTPGQEVKKGDLLVKLDASEAEAMLRQAKIEATSRLSVEAAKAQLELTKVEEKSIKQMAARDATTRIEVERIEVQVKLRELELALQQQQLDINRAELARHEANVEKYYLRAPRDGVVADVMVETGETVEDREDVVRLVVTDPLRINAAVPIDRTLEIEVGDTAWVTPQLEGFSRPIEAKVIYVAPVGDAASNTRIVRLEMPNEADLPAGGHVMVDFEHPEPAVAQVEEAQG